MAWLAPSASRRPALDIKLNFTGRPGARRDVEGQWPVLGCGLVDQEEHHRPLDGPACGSGLWFGQLFVAAHLATEPEREQALARDRLELRPLGVDHLEVRRDLLSRVGLVLDQHEDPEVELVVR